MTDAEGSTCGRRDRANSQPPTAAVSAIAVPAIQAAWQRLRRPAVGGGGTGLLKASTNCAAEVNRSAGTLASALVMAASTDGGTVERTVRSVGHRIDGMPRHDGLHRRALERRISREHLVEQAAERVDVAARVDVALSRRLLRAHVARRPQRQPGLGQFLAAHRAHRPCDTEVGHPGMAILQEDVLGLEVAMNEPMAMGVIEGISDLAEELQRLVDRQLGLAVHQVAE